MKNYKINISFDDRVKFDRVLYYEIKRVISITVIIRRARSACQCPPSHMLCSCVWSDFNFNPKFPLFF
jgi:hypothetical protein